MFRVLICEDDVKDEKLISKYVSNFFNKQKIPFSLTIYNTAERAAKDYASNVLYDIVLLDIVLPKMSGIDLAKKIRKKDPNSNIIFITSSKDFAIESYQVKAYYYLMKPFKPTDLTHLLSQLVQSIKDADTKFITLSSKFGYYKINHKDILFIESFKRQITIHIKNEKSVTLNEKLDVVQQKLNDPRFLRCHKSYLVNMDFVTKLESRTFVFTDGSSAPIPKESLNVIKQKYFGYLATKVQA